MKKRIIVILLVLFLTGNVFGQTGLDFQAIENSGKITITGYTGTETNLTIPETANGMPIVAIGKDAFRGKRLTSITIPVSVINIGDAAFADNQLTSVTIGANVTFGSSAIGSGFETAYNYGGKPAGTYRRDSTNSSIWGMISGEFLYIGSTITRYTGSGGAVTIPSIINGTPVTSIESNAFYDKRLTSVTIPDSVIHISENAFAINRLTSVTIGNNVTTIGNGAFYDNQLTSVTIPNSVTTIQNLAFSNNRFTNVTIGAGVRFECCCSFGNNFVETYQNGQSVAGTYTRPSTSNNTWTRGIFTF